MATKKVIVDFDEDIQNLRDPETGRYVELNSVVGAKVVGVERGEDDQLVLILEGVEDEED